MRLGRTCHTCIFLHNVSLSSYSVQMYTYNLKCVKETKTKSRCDVGKCLFSQVTRLVLTGDLFAQTLVRVFSCLNGKKKSKEKEKSKDEVLCALDLLEA